MPATVKHSECETPSPNFISGCDSRSFGRDSLFKHGPTCGAVYEAENRSSRHYKISTIDRDKFGGSVPDNFVDFDFARKALSQLVGS